MTEMKKISDEFSRNLELLILGEERGADDLKDWPPILPPVLAADAS